MAMAENNWGHCRDCKWWQIEPDAQIQHDTFGLCTEDALLPYKVRVAGESGCKHFTPGEPARAEGSSAEPATASIRR